MGETLSRIDAAVFERQLLASVHLRIAGDNPAEPHLDHDQTCDRYAEALVLAPSLKATRLFCDTLVDNDRGYFPRPGAIDRAGNPNKLFDVIRKAHVTREA